MGEEIFCYLFEDQAEFRGRSSASADADGSWGFGFLKEGRSVFLEVKEVEKGAPTQEPSIFLVVGEPVSLASGRVSLSLVLLGGFALICGFSGFSGCAGVAGQVLHDGLKSFSP